MQSLATRELAQRLHAHEIAEREASGAMGPASFRVYEKLRRPLCALAGIAGFQSLASRALTLARSESPSLAKVRIAADGNLQGSNEPDPQPDGREADKGEVILIARMLELLFLFIGEALTIRLVLDVWPEAALDADNSWIGRNA